VAPDYEWFLPEHPDELVSQVLAYAGRPVRTALEIGGHRQSHPRVRAPRRLRHGHRPAMLSELRRRVPESVATREAAFEDLPLAPAYDLVFAAASLHWTRPEGRWTRVAAMLAPGGIFASFGGQRGWPILMSGTGSRLCAPLPRRRRHSLSGRDAY
jgi:Methyltransferase domain